MEEEIVQVIIMNMDYVVLNPQYVHQYVKTHVSFFPHLWSFLIVAWSILIISGDAQAKQGRH